MHVLARAGHLPGLLRGRGSLSGVGDSDIWWLLCAVPSVMTFRAHEGLSFAQGRRSCSLTPGAHCLVEGQPELHKGLSPSVGRRAALHSAGGELQRGTLNPRFKYKKSQQGASWKGLRSLRDRDAKARSGLWADASGLCVCSLGKGKRQRAGRARSEAAWSLLPPC